LTEVERWHVVEKLNPTAKMLVRHEIGDIKKRLRRTPLKRCIRLAELKGTAPPAGGRRPVKTTTETSWRTPDSSTATPKSAPTETTTPLR